MKKRNFLFILIGILLLALLFFYLKSNYSVMKFRWNNEYTKKVLLEFNKTKSKERNCEIDIIAVSPNNFAYSIRDAWLGTGTHKICPIKKSGVFANGLDVWSVPNKEIHYFDTDNTHWIALIGPRIGPRIIIEDSYEDFQLIKDGNIINKYQIHKENLSRDFKKDIFYDFVSERIFINTKEKFFENNKIIYKRSNSNCKIVQTKFSADFNHYILREECNNSKSDVNSKNKFEFKVIYDNKVVYNGVNSVKSINISLDGSAFGYTIKDRDNVQLYINNNKIANYKSLRILKLENNGNVIYSDRGNKNLISVYHNQNKIKSIILDKNDSIYATHSCNQSNDDLFYMRGRCLITWNDEIPTYYWFGRGDVIKKDGHEYLPYKGIRLLVEKNNKQFLFTDAGFIDKNKVCLFYLNNKLTRELLSENIGNIWISSAGNNYAYGTFSHMGTSDEEISRLYINNKLASKHEGAFIEKAEFKNDNEFSALWWDNNEIFVEEFKIK